MRGGGGGDEQDEFTDPGEGPTLRHDQASYVRRFTISIRLHLYASTFQHHGGQTRSRKLVQNDQSHQFLVFPSLFLTTYVANVMVGCQIFVLDVESTSYELTGVVNKLTANLTSQARPIARVANSRRSQ
jgi:hypothetical protein